MSMYSPSAVKHLVGSRVGDYLIERLLDQSTIHIVYSARSHMQGQEVTLTTFTLPDRFSIQARERFSERFIHVFSAIARLRHSNILPVYDFGMESGYLYMVAPLITATPLMVSLQPQSPFSLDQVLEIMRQVAA